MRRLILSAALVTLAACGPSSPPASQGSPPPATTSAAPATATGPSAEEIQAAIAALPAPYNQANYQAGRSAFGQCRSCHNFERNGVGPSLHGVVGREIASAPGFTYSRPAQDANFVWDAPHLDQWIADPRAMVPGNSMGFAGVRNEEQRRNLVAYVMVESAR